MQRCELVHVLSTRSAVRLLTYQYQFENPFYFTFTNILPLPRMYVWITQKPFVRFSLN